MNKEQLYMFLRIKLEAVGFQYEKDQIPYFQSMRERELKFIHPALIERWEKEGESTRAKKFYIKPLSNKANGEIGFVTGKSSPLNLNNQFKHSNSIDQYDGSPAWINRGGEKAIDELLTSIKNYLERFDNIVYPVEENIDSYLFTWNPSKWDWIDFEKSLKKLDSGSSVEMRWSCGNSKRIRKGDRIFLMKLGGEPSGIMGSGYAKSSYYVGEHWDGTEGKTTNYVDIEFEVLIDPERSTLFSKEYLTSVDPYKNQQWFPQQSGISIKNEFIGGLESLWFFFIRANGHIRNNFLSNDVPINTNRTYFEGKSKEVTQTRYERNPSARKKCLEHHGFSCKVCEFNFENVFGEIGKGFIHVHHRTPISEIREGYYVDPINDLVPVCPNCHAMIHSKKPAYELTEIKEIIDMARISEF